MTHTTLLANDQIGAKEPKFILTLLMSIVGHVAVVVFLLLAANQTPLPQTPAIEASLVDGGELSDIQGQIASAYQKNRAQNSAESRQSVRKPTQQPSYRSDIAERERAYQAQMEEHAKMLDQEVLSDMQLYRQARDEEDKERQQQVDDLRNKERSNDDIAKENRQSQDKVREQIDNTLKESRNITTTHQDFGSADGAPSLPNVERGGGVGSRGNGGGGSGMSRSQAQANIAGRVQKKWERYDNPPNRRLSATISIDDNGQVTNIRFGSGDKDLESSLESSIKEASPFPEMVGIASTFTINFSTR